MKCKGAEYIIPSHGIFVDDMMHTYSCDAMMKDEFLAMYKKDLEVTA